MSVKVSECAAKYALAMVDPFDSRCDGVCLPLEPCQPSHKIRGYLRGTGVINTTGLGWILASPSPCNDAWQVFVSASTGVNPYVSIYYPSSPSEFVGYSVTNIPYNYAQLVGVVASNTPPTVSARVVAAGLKVAYTGTVLNSSGLFYTLCEPSHSNLYNGTSSTPAFFGSYRTCQIKSVEPGSSVLVSGFPVVDRERSYTNQIVPFEGTVGDYLPAYPWSAGGIFPALPASGTFPDSSTVGAPPIGVLITGQPGQQFYFEYTLHCEFVGPGAQASVTPTHLDLKGADLAMRAMTEYKERISSNPQCEGMQCYYDAFKHVVADNAPIALDRFLGLPSGTSKTTIRLIQKGVKAMKKKKKKTKNMKSKMVVPRSSIRVSY